LEKTKLWGILRITLAILLILFGIAICVAGIGIHIVYLYDRYQGFAENGYFDSFLHYYYAVGKGNLVSSILLGMIPVGIGIYLLKK
jgi:hypothetical protein